MIFFFFAQHCLFLLMIYFPLLMTCFPFPLDVIATDVILSSKLLLFHLSQLPSLLFSSPLYCCPYASYDLITVQLLTFPFGNHLQERQEVTEMTSNELNVLTLITDSWCLNYGIFKVQMRSSPYSKQSLILNDNVLSCRDQKSDLLQGSVLLTDLFKILNYSLEDNMLNSAHRCRLQAARELLD